MAEISEPLIISQTSCGLVVSGEIDSSTVDLLSSSLIPTPGGSGEFSIDMAEVGFIDSSGLRVLIQAHQHAEQSQRTLMIVNPSPIVSRLFAVSGLDELFNITNRA